MSKRYKTLISRYAEDDLIEIIEYYVVKNESYAQKLLISLETRVEELKTLPERGRVVPELKKQNIMEYRELVEGNYRIIYAIEGSTVTIHTILDSRRNIEDLLLKKLLRMYS
jgi:toxin ParE1/3/4